MDPQPFSPAERNSRSEAMSCQPGEGIEEWCRVNLKMQFVNDYAKSG
ncbi:MAG: hypothetical protein WC710_09290 [Gallionella sp.]